MGKVALSSVVAQGLFASDNEEENRFSTGVFAISPSECELYVGFRNKNAMCGILEPCQKRWFFEAFEDSNLVFPRNLENDFDVNPYGSSPVRLTRTGSPALQI